MQTVLMELSPPAAHLRGRRCSLGNIYSGVSGAESGVLTRPNFQRGRRSTLSNIHEVPSEPAEHIASRQLTSDLTAQYQITASTRRNSYFTQRASVFPEKSDGCPTSLQLFTFYRKLKTVCSLKPAVECQYTCFTNVEATGIEEETFRAGGLLQQTAQDGGLEEIQFQLYLKEIQRINPTLEEGNLFVDGLYELVCSMLPHSVDSPLKKSVNDLLTVHSSKTLLLQKYWRRPDDPSEHSAYLAIASSFVQYVLTTYGAKGVSEFLGKLDCSINDPQSENFSFKGKNITTLEFKWTKFAEAHVNEEFSLSTLGMLRLLFRRHLLFYWLHLVLIAFIMFIDAGTSLGLAIATGQIITLGQTSQINSTSSELISEREDDDELMYTFVLLQWAGISVGLILTHFVLVVVTTTLQTHVAVCVSKKLRRQLSNRLHHVTPKFLTDHSSSAIISTFLQDVNVIEKLIAYSLRTVLFGVLMLCIFVAYTLSLIWQLAVPLSVVYITGQVLVWLITAKLSEHSFAKSQATGKLCDILKEEIDGYHVNRLYGLGHFWGSSFNRILHKQFSTKARCSLFLERFTLLIQVTVPQIISSLLTFSFVLLLRYGFLSFERGLSIVLFFAYVVMHVIAAAGDFPTLHNATLALQRINSMLYNHEHSFHNGNYSQTERKHTQNQINRTLVPDNLSIEFRDVCFSYIATASHWNLFDVSLKVEPGERLAVVGKSGSGKSSFLYMILQLYQPTHGEIIFGGSESEFEGLKVAATFQFNHIFNMSIRENIRIGNLQASDKEVEEASKLADLHVWVSSLSRGYDTAVSSGGSSLSGGQKQRIAIARMLVANAPILVLDEVTSALDPATEKKVFNKLMEVTVNKTVVAVTHRLEQAKEFDRIVVLSHGKITEIGSHDHLMTLKGTYWRMWSNRTSASPEQGVPIIRRRGSITSECLSTPLIRPVKSAPVLTTPMITPLVSVAEGNEVTSRSATLDGTLLQNLMDSKQDIELNTSLIPRTASTPAHCKESFNKVLGVQRDAGSPDLNSNAASPDLIPNAASPDLNPNAGSPDLNPNAGSPDLNPNAGSPDLNPNAGSPDLNPNAGSPDLNPNVGSPDLNPNAGSPDLNPNAGSPDLNPNAGSPDLNPNAGSPDLNPYAGSPDLNPNVGSPDLNPNVGSPDLNPNVGSPDLNPNAGSPDLNSNVDDVSSCDDKWWSCDSGPYHYQV